MLEQVHSEGGKIPKKINAILFCNVNCRIKKLTPLTTRVAVSKLKPTNPLWPMFNDAVSTVDGI